MDAASRLAFAHRIVAACRASNEAATCHAVREVAVTCDVKHYVQHDAPLLHAMAVVNEVVKTGNDARLDAVLLVVSAIEAAK